MRNTLDEGNGKIKLNEKYEKDIKRNANIDEGGE